MWLPKDVWINCVLKRLSPLALARLQCSNRFFRDVIEHNFFKVIKEWRTIKCIKSERLMTDVTFSGHMDLIEFVIKQGNNHFEEAMGIAVLKEDVNLIEFFVEKGARHWNVGLLLSVKTGNRSLVDFFITKGANSWNAGFLHAAKYGHLDLVKFFLEKGPIDKMCICDGLYHATENNQTYIANFLRALLQ